MHFRSPSPSPNRSPTSAEFQSKAAHSLACHRSKPTQNERCAAAPDRDRRIAEGSRDPEQLRLGDCTVGARLQSLLRELICKSPVDFATSFQLRPLNAAAPGGLLDERRGSDDQRPRIQAS
eukprot:scaffold1227_cov256-Pinguiococcus_pyrenoidosus.AAC.4